jgi:hypothetical protein
MQGSFYVGTVLILIAVMANGFLKLKNSVKNKN